MKCSIGVPSGVDSGGEGERTMRVRVRARAREGEGEVKKGGG